MATSAKFATAAANEEGHPDTALSIMKELAEDVLAAEPLEVFLMAMVPEGAR